MYYTVEKMINTGYRKETDLLALNLPGLLALALACSCCWVATKRGKAERGAAEAGESSLSGHCHRRQLKCLAAPVVRWRKPFGMGFVKLNASSLP